MKLRMRRESWGFGTLYRGWGRGSNGQNKRKCKGRGII